MVLGTAVALLLFAPQQRVTSEEQAIRIADAFRREAVKGPDGRQVGPELGRFLDCYVEESKGRYVVDYSDGFVWVRAADGRPSALRLSDARHSSHRNKWEVLSGAIQRAEARTQAILEHLAYHDVTALFYEPTIGSGEDAIQVNFTLLWKGVAYPTRPKHSATFDPEGERLVHWNVGMLSRPPDDTSVTVPEEDAERTMRAKMLEVYETSEWATASIKPVIFRVRGDRKPHIDEAHSWGWETGPPSIMAWEGIFEGPGGRLMNTDSPSWEVVAFLDAKTGAMLEMRSRKGLTTSLWKPPKP